MRDLEVDVDVAFLILKYNKEFGTYFDPTYMTKGDRLRLAVMVDEGRTYSRRLDAASIAIGSTRPEVEGRVLMYHCDFYDITPRQFYKILMNSF